MSPQLRLLRARAEIACLRDAATSGSYDDQVLAANDQLLADLDGDTWFLKRIDRGGHLATHVLRVLAIYAPHEPSQPAATTTPSEAHV